MRQNTWLLRITRAAVIAAVYATLTMVLNPISFGPIQFRIAEAMTVLPFIFPEASIGLFIGCALSNILSSYGLLDVVLGSIATLIAAFLTSKAKKMWLAPLPPVLVNAVIVGFLITFYETGMTFTAFSMGLYLFNASMLLISQSVICYGMGLPLLIASKKLINKAENT